MGKLVAREVKTKKNGKGTGRNLIDVDFDKVMLLCQMRYTGEEVASALGIDYDTLNRACKREHGEGFFVLARQQRAATKSLLDKKIKERKNLERRKAYKESPSIRIEFSMRARIWQALKGKGRGDGLLSKLEYSIEDLILHLSSLLNNGMTLENYGEWHVDHIRPCALFDQTDENQFRECWRLENLQPLWASDNLKKGAKHG